MWFLSEVGQKKCFPIYHAFFAASREAQGKLLGVASTVVSTEQLAGKDKLYLLLSCEVSVREQLKIFYNVEEGQLYH